MTIPKISPWIGQLVRVKEFEKCFWQSFATIFFFFKWDGYKFSCSLRLQSIMRKWVCPYHVNWTYRNTCYLLIPIVAKHYL